MSFEGHRMYILERQFCSIVSGPQLPEGVVVLFTCIHSGGSVIRSYILLLLVVRRTLMSLASGVTLRVASYLILKS
jgi:hypothetical protein